jgi:hypothetical protein
MVRLYRGSTCSLIWVTQEWSDAVQNSLHAELSMVRSYTEVVHVLEFELS